MKKDNQLVTRYKDEVIDINDLRPSPGPTKFGHFVWRYSDDRVQPWQVKSKQGDFDSGHRILLDYLVSQNLLRRVADNIDLAQYIRDLDRSMSTDRVQVMVFDVLSSPFAELPEEAFVDGHWWLGSHIRS